MADIKVEALRHVYSEGTPFERVAIEDISVEIPAGQFVGIIGHTGSGKSTFIQHLNGLLQPSAGTVTLGGQNIFETKKITHNIRFRVGLVFQYPEYQLFEETVYKDISFGPKNMGLDEKEIDAHVRRAAAFTGISENLFEDSPLELSGGQKRRVAIAGVIAMEPEVLILDEPTAGLDPEGCRQILENICTYKRETGATVILVSHRTHDCHFVGTFLATCARACNEFVHVAVLLEAFVGTLCIDLSNEILALGVHEEGVAILRAVHRTASHVRQGCCLRQRDVRATARLAHST